LKTKWRYDQPGGDIKLQYYELKVETVQNDAFGIEAGVQGALKIYLSLNPSSDAIPYKKDIHQDYFDNYDSWRAAISTSSDSSEDIAFFDSHSVTSVSKDSDKLFGSTEDQIIVADRKSEIISGAKGSDFLIGSHSDQVLKGGSGRDLVSGKGGNDLLIGGRGADKLHGGDGADVFKYKSIKDSSSLRDLSDKIMDFDVKKDRIDLSSIQKKLSLNYIGSSQFESPGDIRITGRSLYLNANSDPSPEMKIILVGLKPGTFGEVNLIT
jgi:Ca2+-binding RTX toxin-like protein